MGLKIGLKQRTLFQKDQVSNAVKGVVYKFRWFNHLDPSIKKEKWTDEEDLTILKAH